MNTEQNSEKVRVLNKSEKISLHKAHSHQCQKSPLLFLPLRVVSCTLCLVESRALVLSITVVRSSVCQSPTPAFTFNPLEENCFENLMKICHLIAKDLYKYIYNLTCNFRGCSSHSHDENPVLSSSRLIGIVYRGLLKYIRALWLMQWITTNLVTHSKRNLFSVLKVRSLELVWLVWTVLQCHNPLEPPSENQWSCTL